MLIYSLFQPKYALLLSLLMVVLVAVWTGRLRRRIELIKLQLLRIAKPAADLFTRGENFHFQQDDDQIAGDMQPWWSFVNAPIDSIIICQPTLLDWCG